MFGFLADIGDAIADVFNIGNPAENVGGAVDRNVNNPRPQFVRFRSMGDAGQEGFFENIFGDQYLDEARRTLPDKYDPFMVGGDNAFSDSDNDQATAGYLLHNAGEEAIMQAALSRLVADRESLTTYQSERLARNNPFEPVSYAQRATRAIEGTMAGNDANYVSPNVSPTVIF